MIIYFGHSRTDTLSKEDIEKWCQSYDWSPKELADELGIDTHN